MKENETNKADLILLQRSFIGAGDPIKSEIGGFLFEQVEMSERAYIYSVAINDKVTHFEVFKRLSYPVCIDFETKVYSETERKEAYPRAGAFGVTAWTFKNLNSAKKKFNEIS